MLQMHYAKIGSNPMSPFMPAVPTPLPLPFQGSLGGTGIGTPLLLMGLLVGGILWFGAKSGKKEDYR